MRNPFLILRSFVRHLQISLDHRFAETNCPEQFDFGSNPDPGSRGGRAVGGEVDRLVGLDVECREMVAPLELRPRSDAAGQFEVVADVEELDKIVVISAELNKR